MPWLDYHITAGMLIGIVPENESGNASGVCGNIAIVAVLIGTARY